MNRSDICLALVLLVMGIVGIFFIIPAQTPSGVLYGLSPAFFPNVCLTAVCIFSLMLLFQAVRSSGSGDEGAPLGLRGFRHIFVSTLLLTASYIIIHLIGFIAANTFTVFSFMLYMKERRPMWLVPFSLFFPLTIFLLLWKFLGIRLI